MGHWEWEAGTITLPSAEFARVRQAVQEADRAFKEQVFTDCQTFWKGLTRKEQTDPAAYKAAVTTYDNETYRSTQSSCRFWSEKAEAERLATRQRRWAVSAQLQRCLRVGKPSRVLQADMNFPTNKTTDFRFDDGSITFDREKRTVRWETDENRRGVENARNSARGKALFTALKTVKWTAGTGGVLSGNDEYNQEDDNSGGGANYDTVGYGPIGVRFAPTKTGDYDTPTGRVKVDLSWGRYGWKGKAVKVGQGRVPQGVRAGGQFTARRNAEPKPLQ